MIMQVEHLSKSFGGRTLFSDVTFKLEEYDRLALVGPNGAGKTTMLQHHQRPRGRRRGPHPVRKGRPCGLPGAGSHRDARSPHLRGGHVLAGGNPGSRAASARVGESLGDNPTERQLAATGRARDAYEMLGGYTIEAKVRGVLFGLGFKEGDIKQATTNFSGGWQMRIALAKLLVRNPEVLMLDEPTNHLDLESVKWLEGFLRGYEGTVIVVSHDREFMDNMIDRVAEVANGRVNLYKGNYSAYLQGARSASSACASSAPASLRR